MKIEMFDRVKLKDGRIVTVVDIYDKKTYGTDGYEVELPEGDPQGVTIGVTASDITEVIK